MFFQTGIDSGTTGVKKVCVFASPILSFYRLAGEKERGKRIYVIPSHRVLLKKLPQEIKDTSLARKYVESEVLSLLKGRSIIWKLWCEEDGWRVLLAEPEGKLPRGALWDAEPVALTRAFLTTGLKEGEVWDFGEKKTTRVIIKKGRLSFFQVFFETFPQDASPEKDSWILLSGGKSKKKEVLEFFKNTSLKHIEKVPPEKISAFGAALWGVVGRTLPAFHSSLWELSPETIKKLSIFLLTSLALTTLSWGSIKFLTPKIKKKLQIKEREIFKEVYHQTPVVSPLLQVKTMIEEEKKTNFYTLLKKALSSIPKQAKLFSINYDGINLSVKIEVSEELSKEISGNVSSVKKLPGGTEILELIFSREEENK